MARPLRIQHVGARYHLMSRGDRREAIFYDDAGADERLTTFLELERVTRETSGHRGKRMIGLLERKLNPLRKKPAT